MSLHHLFIGTYTNSGSRGIYALELDSATGVLSVPRIAAETGNPTYLAFSPNRRFLYAVNNTPALAIGYAADIAQARLTPLPLSSTVPEKEPCYVAVDPTARAVVVAHYHQGYLASLPLRPDGSLGAPVSVIRHSGPGTRVVPGRQDKPHVHCTVISPDGRHVLVCDLGLDRIFYYALDAASATLTPTSAGSLAVAPGTGPRHLTFAPNGEHAFLIGELGNTISAYTYDAASGTLALHDTHPTLPADFRGQNTAAAIRVHPNGHFIYGSNRGHDSIAVLAFDAKSGRLTPVEIVPSGGKGPRDFALSPDGAWLVAAHQESNSLTAFRVDPDTGRLSRVDTSTQLSAPVCVLFGD